MTVAVLAVLSGCTPSGTLTPERVGPPPPKGTREISQPVDGLVVGHRLMAAGEYELALKAYYRAAVQHGLTADVLSSVGAANLKLGRLGQAETDFRAALHLDPNSIQALNNLGVTLMQKGDYAEAQQVFRRAFALDSGHSDVIRENLKRAIALMGNSGYSPQPEGSNFELVRRGDGQYLLRSTK